MGYKIYNPIPTRENSLVDTTPPIYKLSLPLDPTHFPPLALFAFFEQQYVGSLLCSPCACH